MFKRYIDQALGLFNYVDGMMIVDSDSVIVYYYTGHPKENSLRPGEALGKKLLDVYPSLTEDTSVIMQVLRTGKAVMNYEQTFVTYKGQSMHTINSAIPIYHKDKIIGVADIVIYLNLNVQNRNITIDINMDKMLETSRKQNQYHLDDIITCDETMLEMKRKIALIHESNAQVMVCGRTGSGKELVVKAIHNSSVRQGHPLITQNCAAIPSTLLESILFGTVKGSFTGAQDRPGLFEIARGGTLFLDEINSMELNAQAKLLRAIEEKKIRRVGDCSSRNVDVRILSAVNEDPIQCVREGKLREDLYYRLAVIRFDIPPLSERICDIPLLMEYFREEFNREYNKDVRHFTDEVKEIFLTYSWPGNVRELRNAIESSYPLNYSTVFDAEYIPVYIREATRKTELYFDAENFDTSLSLAEMLYNYERAIIQKAYLKNNSNISRTAGMLKLSKQLLSYKLKKFNIIS